MASVEQIVESCRSLESKDRRTVVARIVEDMVTLDGREDSLLVLLDSAFASASAKTKAEMRTLTAFLRLPPDTQRTLLEPVDMSIMDDAHCLTDEQLERIHARAAGGVGVN